MYRKKEVHVSDGIDMSFLVIGQGEVMHIDKKYFQTDTVYKNIGNNSQEGQIGCGLIHTVLEKDAKQKVNLSHYGAFLVLHGEGLYVDERGKEYPLSPGCFVQRIPGVSHTTIVHPQQDWLEFFVVFGAETYETMKKIGIMDSRPVLNPELDDVLLGKCLYLLNKMKQSQDYENMFLYVSVLNFVLFSYFSDSQRRFGSEREKEYQKMELAAKMLCESPKKKTTGKIVANNLDIGYESFRKKFKSVYHISPNAYQLNYRINYAKTLLSDENITLEEIADLCGFSDGFAFSKAFKKRCGISPEQFRRSI